MDISKCTFAMVKPHIVKEGKLGEVISFIEGAGFKIKMMSMENLSLEEAEIFYDVHKSRPFFNDLCKIMSEGSVVALCLEKESSKNSVEDFRNLLGNTDPSKAAEGTIRAKFGKNLDYNAVHGSDSSETAIEELEFFFSNEIYGYDDCCDDEDCCYGDDNECCDC